jgi:hypothetical protein
MPLDRCAGRKRRVQVDECGCRVAQDILNRRVIGFGTARYGRNARDALGR